MRSRGGDRPELLARDARRAGADMRAESSGSPWAILTGGLNSRGRPWAAAEVEPARYASARLAALRLSQQGPNPRAGLARRAREHCADNRRGRCGRGLCLCPAQNQWCSSQLEFNVARSDNVNNRTTTDPSPSKGTLPLHLRADGRQPAALGHEIHPGRQPSLQAARGARSLTYAEATGFGRTYRLSSEATDLVPGAEGSDYAEAQLTFGLGHFWLPAGGRDPWQFDIARGRFWYGGEPYLDFLRAGVTRPVTLSDTDRLRFGATWETLEETDGDTSEALALRAGWEHVFEDRGVLSLGLRGRVVEAEGLDKAYEARAVTLGWQFAGSGLSVAYDLEERDYETSLYVIGTRTDTRHALRLSVPVPQVEVYGFRPVINAERTRTVSNVSRFDTESTGVGLTFRSAF